MPRRPLAASFSGVAGLIFLCLLTASAATNTPAPVPIPAPASGDFETANRLMAEGRFAEGAAAYDALAAGGRTSAALEYNRAQARARAGDIGRAWAHLRLAGRLDPRDPAIRRAAHQLASRIPAANATGDAPLEWLHRLTLDEWAALALPGMWLWGGFLLAGLWRPAWRDRFRRLTAICGALAVVTSALAATALWSRWRASDVLVLRPEAQVRVSPLEEARTAFTLPAGSELRHRARRGDWVMVEESGSGRFGWLHRANVAVLPFR
ncbi:MAG: hypothetical protein KIT22_10720 [Verrucomicrobiae bacterium]|nr:hypothetical protein [Verrucomicrobiae bacterium]